MPERLVEIKGFEELTREFNRFGNLSERAFRSLHDAMSQAVQTEERPIRLSF